MPSGDLHAESHPEGICHRAESDIASQIYRIVRRTTYRPPCMPFRTINNKREAFCVGLSAWGEKTAAQTTTWFT